MPRRNSPPAPDTPCRELWNLSELSAGWLAEEGIATYADLCAADLCALWLRVKQRHAQVTKMMFVAMAGAVHNVHWRYVPRDLLAGFEAFRDGLEPAGPMRKRKRRGGQPPRR